MKNGLQNAQQSKEIVWSQNQDQRPKTSGPRTRNDLVPELGHSTEYSSYTENKELPRSSALPSCEEEKHPELGMEAERKHGNADSVSLVPEPGPDKDNAKVPPSYSNLFWDSKYDPRERWCHRLGTSKATPEELAEMTRRNAAWLTPEQVQQ